jgi:hypothetical protein
MAAHIREIEPTGFRPGSRRRKRRWPIGSASVAALLLACAVLLARTQAPQAPDETGVPAAASPAWIDISQPIELFALDAPDLANSKLIYEARRRRTGGGREDILTFGKLNGEEPFLRLMLYRVGTEPAPQAPLFVDLARMAAMADLWIARSLTPAELATRFGAFEAADIDLAAEASAPRSCLGFRGAGLNTSFRINGFACGTPARPMSRPALTCLLDRLDLNSAGDDPALAGFFAETELRRDPACAGTGLAPTLVQANWIDQDDAAPPLRLRKAH